MRIENRLQEVFNQSTTRIIKRQSKYVQNSTEMSAIKYAFITSRAFNLTSRRHVLETIMFGVIGVSKAAIFNSTGGISGCHLSSVVFGCCA